jgi:hypothetical protein
MTLLRILDMPLSTTEEERKPRARHEQAQKTTTSSSFNVSLQDNATARKNVSLGSLNTKEATQRYFGDSTTQGEVSQK